MPVPSDIALLSTTPGSNSPAGSESPATFDDYMRTFAAFIAQLRDGKAATADAVLLTGNQTIAGVKTFSSPIVGSATNVTGVVAVANGGTGSALGVILRGYLAGLAMSTAGASATMSIAAGQAADAGGALMTLASAIAKTTSAWTVGNANGGLDTGGVANNTWYHFHLIRRPDTGVVDVLFSLSATAPTLPANYTQFRRIGSGRTNGSAQWVRFFQSGDQFLWDNLGTLDFNGASTTSATLSTLSVPTGVKVNALMNVLDNNATSNAQIYFSDPDVSDVAPSVSAWPLGSAGAPLNGTISTAQVRCTTNTSAQVRHRSTVAGSTLRVATIGWIDSRGVQ